MAYQPSDFIYWKSDFPTLTDSQIQTAIAYVESTWYACLSFWQALPYDLQQSKRKFLESLLVAWYLNDMYPDQTNTMGTGGMPMSEKEIGKVRIKFLEYQVQDGMKPLLSNVFGIKAMDIIISAPERYNIWG